MDALSVTRALQAAAPAKASVSRVQLCGRYFWVCEKASVTSVSRLVIKLRFYSNLREGDVLKFKCKITYINIYIYI